MNNIQITPLGKYYRNSSCDENSPKYILIHDSVITFDDRIEILWCIYEDDIGLWYTMPRTEFYNSFTQIGQKV